MKISIPRCIKPPGLIIRAKTYFLELNDKGLYMIALGNATVMPNTRSYFQQAVADAAVNHFQSKYEVQIQENLQRIRNGELDQLASSKYSYFLAKNDVREFNITPDAYNGARVKIKGNGVKLTLVAPFDAASSLQEMAKALGK